MKRLLVCGALLAAGCGRNAFLELQIDLPANTTGSNRFAIISIASGNRPFPGTWGGDGTLPGVALDTKTSTKSISVEGNSDSFDKVVEVKVVFCVQQDCLGKNDDNAPEAHLTIERAFYEGKRTSYEWTIDCMPTVDATCKEPNPIDKQVKKCEVAGCRAGTSSSYCVGDKHFCES
ncbi:MAG: hypothetical protein ACXWUG_21995 [Polyangiales bacterium]